MKRISKIVLVFVLLVAAAFTAMACNTKSIQSISIEPGDEPPKRVYIIGQDTELNLFAGFLTVTYSNGTTERIQLDDPNITVSGFDAQKAGDQELTVSYGGQTCPLSIKVVNRFTLTDGVVDYFVGEPFDRSGKLIITDDDGSTRSVDFSDASVIVNGTEDFSNTAGEKALTVSYGNVTDKLQVKVHELADASLSLSSSVYDSHENGIDLNKSKIILKNKEAVDGKSEYEGAIQKEVPLTREILSAGGSNDQAVFNAALGELLESAGVEEGKAYNPNISTKKTISFTYAGKSISREITITLSRASYIMFYAEKYSGIDYGNFEETEDPNEQGDLILNNDYQKDEKKVTEVAEMYFNLSDKSDVPTDMRNDLVKLAAYYWYNQFIDAINEINAEGQIFDLRPDEITGEKVFSLHTVFNDDGEIKSTYEHAREMYDGLIDENNKHTEKLTKVDNAIANLYKVLGDEELASLQMTVDINDEPISVGTYFILAVSQSELQALLDDLKVALDLYKIIADANITLEDIEGLKNNPDDGRKSDIKIAIGKVYNKIVPTQNPGETAPTYDRANYMLLKIWNPEFFDILYQYYWDIAHDSTSETEKTKGWNSLIYLAYYSILPSDDFENFYSTATLILDIVDNMMNNTEHPIIDATEVYYYYDLLLDYYEKLEKETNELYKNLYKEIGLLYPLVSEKYGGPVTKDYAMNEINDYYSQFSSVAGKISSINEFLQEYITMYANYQNGLYLRYNEETQKSEYTDKFKEDIQELMTNFFELSPAEEYYFFSGISTYYNTAELRFLDMSSIATNSSPYTSFTGFISSYYYNTLDEETFDTLNGFFYSYESFIRRYIGTENDREIAKNQMIDHYKKAKESYDTLTQDKQASIQFAYDKVKEIYDLYDDEQKYKKIEISSINDKEWEDKVTKLLDATKDFYYNYVCSSLGFLVTSPYIASSLKFEKAYKDFFDEYNKLKESSPELYAKVKKVLSFGEFTVFAVTIEDEDIHEEINQPIDFSIYQTISDYLFFEITPRFGFGGDSLSMISISELFEYNEGMRDVFIELADYIIPGQYMFTGQEAEFDFENLDEAIKVFGKFYNVSETDYNIDQKMALWYTNSTDPNGGTSLDLLAMSSMAYYAKYFVDEEFEDTDGLTSALTAYIALVEGYLNYKNLLDYTDEITDNLGDQQAGYEESLNAARDEYNEAKKEFENAYNALKDLDAFDELFTHESQEFFKTAPEDAH